MNLNSENQITDVSPLASFTELETLSPRGNPLNDDAINRQIPALEANGINEEVEL